jgi:hypothetical protein
MGGMAGLSDEQHKMFQARLKRINRGGPNTSGHIVVGPAEVDKKPRRARRVRRPGDFVSRLSGAIGHLFVAPVSFALGGFAMLAGIVGAHQVGRMELPDVAQAGLLGHVMDYREFIIAGLVVLIVGGLLRLNRGPRKLAVLAGLAGVFVLQDQIVATYPDVFAQLMPETPLALPEIPELASLTDG